MTEDEWLEYATPGEMLRFLGDRASGRKLWLFACNCVDFVSRSLLRGLQVEVEPPSELAWSAADAVANQSDLGSTAPPVGQPSFIMVSSSVAELTERFSEQTLDVAFREQKLRAATQIRTDVESLAVQLAKENGQDTATASYSARTRMTSFLRDIFGNPFHRVSLDPTWLTSTVIALARQMYDSRDFSAMPILADALEDASCDNETILTHCRGPGPHTRGCWVLDLLTSRE